MIATTHRLPWRPRPSSVCWICLLCLLLVLLKAKDVAAVDCKTIPCLHNSPCVESKVSGAWTYRCSCPLGWVGSHCQSEFRVSLTTVTMTTVTLATNTLSNYAVSGNEHNLWFEKLYQAGTGDSRTLNELDVLKVGNGNLESTSVQYLQYSVQYWSLNQSHLCNILPETSKSVITISGLRGNTEYIFCAKTSQIKQCNFDLVNQYSNVSYCISVKTSSVNIVPDIGVPNLYVILLVSVALVSLLILFAIIIFAVKRRYFCSNSCARRKYAKRSREKRKRHNKYTYDTNVESLLLSSPRTNQNNTYVSILESPRPDSSASNQNIRIHKPSSPGKPEHHLVHKRLRGYAAFAARNEQMIALNTVIEYDMPEGDTELNEEADVANTTQTFGTFTGNIQEM